jgi:hypothetical protein
MLRHAPLQAFSEFGKHMLDSEDIDPIYPVLRQLISDLELGRPQAEWLVVLYLAYYEITSALTAFRAHPDPDDRSICGDLTTLKLPTGIERRGLRQPHLMAAHLESWLSRFDGRGFFTPAQEWFANDLYFNDGVLDQYIQGVAYNGRWASYKAREVVHKVLGYPNAAADAGHEGSSGPRKGLTLFFPEVKGNGPRAIEQLDEQTDVLMRATRAHGVEVNVEEVETLLCDFKSLAHGRYYVGHDTDLMLEGILRPGVEDQTRFELLRARRALPANYRGESSGDVGNLKAARWTGRDREAMSAYVQRGVIVYRGADGGWKEVTA